MSTPVFVLQMLPSIGYLVVTYMSSYAYHFAVAPKQGGAPGDVRIMGLRGVLDDPEQTNVCTTDDRVLYFLERWLEARVK